MANEADSRHTVTLPRWGETESEVPSGNVEEPSGGKKNTGWLPGGEGVVGPWWNWLHWATGVFFRYLERSRKLMWTRASMMAGAEATEGVVTIGAGMSVNVTSVRFWTTGAMYKAPSVTNLALAAADPTDPRWDLVVAKVAASVPTFAVITGVPGGAVPVPPAGQAPVAAAFVPAGASAPLLIADLREFGALDLDAFRASKRLLAGDLGGGVYLLHVDGTGIATVKMGGDSNPAFEYNHSTGKVLLRAEDVRFSAPITRKFDIPPAAFVAAYGHGGSLGVDPTNHALKAVIGGVKALAQVRVPNGCKIVAWRVYGNKASSDNLDAALLTKGKGTNAAGLVGATDDTDSAGVGNFIIGDTGLSHIVDQSKVYELLIEFGGAGNSLEVFAAEVEYEEQNPFNGI
jgi:hypothetical protein